MMNGGGGILAGRVRHIHREADHPGQRGGVHICAATVLQHHPRRVLEAQPDPVTRATIPTKEYIRSANDTLSS